MTKEVACRFKTMDDFFEVTFYKDGSVEIKSPYRTYSGRIWRITKNFVIVVAKATAGGSVLKIRISFYKDRIPRACYEGYEETKKMRKR